MISGLKPGDHACRIYESEEERPPAVTIAVRSAEACDRRVIYACDTDEIESVRACLRDAGVDARRLEETDALRFTDVGERLLPGGGFDADAAVEFLEEEAENASQDGYSALVVLIEMRSLRPADRNIDEILRFETLVNSRLTRDDILLIDLYDRRGFSASALLDILAAHPFIVFDGRVRRNHLYVPPEETHEADRTSSLLNRCLESIRSTGEARGDSVRHDASGPSVEADLLGLERRRRREAEQSLELTEDKCRILVEHSTEGIVVVRDERIVFTNRAIRRYLGYDADELAGKPFGEFVHPEDRDRVIENHRRRLSGQSHTHRYPLRLVSRDGSVRWVQIEPVTIQWDGQQALLVFLSDITELKTTEEALRESEELHSLIVRSMHDIVWTVDLALNTTYVSPSVERILGFTPEERMRQSPWEQLTPESLDRAQRSLAESLELDRQGKTEPDSAVKLEMDYYAKDGSLVCLETIMVFLRDEEGIPVGVFGLSRDVTDRKRVEDAVRDSERRLAEIIDFLPDPTLVIDRDGTVVAWNRAIEAMTGITAEEMVGKGDHEYAIPFYGKRRQTLIDLVLCRDEAIEKEYLSIREQGDTLVSESFHPHLGPDGTYLWSAARPLFDSRGEVAGAIESIRDITERQQAQKALKEAKEAAEAADRAKSRFVASVSHEVRTPINAILGYAGILMEEPLDAKHREALDMIKLSGEILLTLVNDVLDLSKIEAGRIEFEHRPFNLRLVVAEACELVRPMIEGKDVSIISDLGEISDLVIGDEVRLFQILTNLLNNAVKFTKAGEVKVAAWTALEPDGRVRAEITVSDTGPGIPADKLDEIFDMFTQVEGSYVSEHPGAGLGLAIARRLARLMDGDISVRSRLGEGSVFTVTVRFEPFSGAELNSPLPGNRLVSAAEGGRDCISGPGAGSSCRLRILLGEDNPIARKMTRWMLEKLGHEVVTAADGIEALAAATRASYDLILMDMQMPRMDGLEAAAALRRRGITTPIVAMTAGVADDDRRRCIDAGMDDYVVKPLKVETVCEMLEGITGRRSPDS